MNHYSELLRYIKQLGEQDDFIHTITQGNTSDFDLDKSNIFPVLNVDVLNAGFTNGKMISFDLEIACMDIRDNNKETREDKFWKQDNEVDNLNEMLASLNRIWFKLLQDIEDKKHQIIEEYNKGTGPHNLGKKYECHPDVIKRILKEGNITLRTRSESQKCRKGEIRRKDLYVRLSEIELLYSQGMNYTQLGKMFNTSDVQIKNLLTKVKKPH